MKKVALVRAPRVADAQGMITPDTKDWTWVLDRPCPECGLDTTTIGRADISGLLAETAAAWHELLTGPRDPRTRPEPEIWSPLEYGCHVRDVCRLYAERLTLMLTVDDPLYPNWDQDRTAIEDRYADQDPHLVADQLVTAATVLAEMFDRITEEQWRRRGRRSDGASFTVETFARYFLHDPVHHLHDAVRR